MILPRDRWLLSSPSVRGVFVGGCVARGEGSRFRAKAHAHISINDPNDGWVCFLSGKWLHVREIWAHEFAHIIAGCGHTAKWRQTVIDLGGTLDEIPGVMQAYYPRLRKTA